VLLITPYPEEQESQSRDELQWHVVQRVIGEQSRIQLVEPAERLYPAWQEMQEVFVVQLVQLGKQL
jgi:hypothetical protein